MTTDRWQLVKQIFHASLERAPAERSAFLDEACEGNDSLRQEVESLLAAHEEDGSFIDSPAYEVAAEWLTDKSESSLVGQQINHYKILAVLGSGGMGEVYLAHDTKLGRKIALKLLPASFTADAERLQRFQQEARATSALNHPNILTIHEIGEQHGKHYIATELIEGQTLRERLASGGITLVDVLDISQQLASALAKAHEVGIVHRDIKPENVMLRSDGYVKVLDFGLAKLSESKAPRKELEAPTRIRGNTVPGTIMGTVNYMSPEQARGLEVDERTDVWSLGVVLYELLSGSPPFKGDTPTDVTVAILEREPPPLASLKHDVPAELDWIVKKALTKDREERYQTAKEMMGDLRNLKRKLEVDAEIERSASPEWRRAATISGQRVPAIEVGAAAKQLSGPKAASRAEYIVNQVKLHKRAASVILAVLVLAAGATLFMYLKPTRAAVLTAKDTILLADFVNTTGDAVFDGTLKQGLAVQLGQSPFLNIFSEDRVRSTLRFMGRSPDEPVTRDVAREVCQREGLKAMLVGSIASLGSHYVITLEAVNAQSSDTIAREQVEAQKKEQVLHALGDAAMKLREQLGESLQSTQKFDAPIEQATTPSLEALKSFSMGVEQQLKGKFLEAIPLLRRATEIDPNFALAYARMASMFYNSGLFDLAAEASQKAYDLRDRVSERERLFISSGYYDNVTGELDKYIETLELWKHTYPNQAAPPNNLAVKYNDLGQFDKAAAEAREAIRLNPNSASGYSLLAVALVGLNRYDEAKEVIRHALAKSLETSVMHRTLFRIAFVQDDLATMKEQIEWPKGKPDEYVAQNWQAEAAAFSGQLRKAKEFSRHAFSLAERRNLKDVTAQIAAGATARDALLGDCRSVKEQTSRALGISNRQLTMIPAGNALAICREFSQAQTIIDDLLRRFPNDTILNKVSVLLVQARIELLRGKPAQAIQLLETTRPYEGYALFQIADLRGQAYLSQQMGAEAATEFQKIIDHRGSQPTSPIYVLAHLGLARAAVLQGDTASARKAYDDFFALWKDADQDIPVLIEARKEYGKLK